MKKFVLSMAVMIAASFCTSAVAQEVKTKAKVKAQPVGTVQQKTTSNKTAARKKAVRPKASVAPQTTVQPKAKPSQQKLSPTAQPRARVAQPVSVQQKEAAATTTRKATGK